MNIPPETIEGCINGDRKAQERLYHLSFNHLMSIACRYRKNRDDAMDIVNQGYYKILKNLKSYDQVKPYNLWINRIITNVLIDDFRRNRKHLVTDTDTMDMDENEVPFELNLFEKHMEAEELNEILLALPEIRNKVFNLYAIDGYNHREISRMLGIPEGTSKWHLSKAREELKELMIQRQKQRNQLNIG